MARMTRADMARRVEDNNLRELLNGNQTFRKFLWTLFTDASIFYPTHQPGSPYDTAYHEGRRSLGLDVLHRLKNLQPGVLGLIEREGDLMTKSISEAAATLPTEEDDPDEDLQPDV